MIVECPRCHARYRVDDEMLPERPTFKCTRCSHLFDSEDLLDSRPAEGSAAAGGGDRAGSTDGGEEGAEAQDEDDSLAFDFAAEEENGASAAATGRDEDEEEAEDEEDEEPANDLGDDWLEEPSRSAGPSRSSAGHAPPPKRGPAAASAGASPAGRSSAGGSSAATGARSGDPFADDPFDFSDDADDGFADDPEDVRDDLLPEEDDGDFVAGRSAPEADDGPAFLRGGDASLPESDRGVEWPILAFLALLLFVYGTLAIYLRNNAEAAEQALRSVPVFGALLADDAALPALVELEDVTAARRRIKNGRRVLVVSGRAVNASDLPLKNVRIEAALLGPGGDALVSAAIYCGNALSLKILNDLSAKEIEILQGLRPSERFTLEPGKDVGFSVVFVDPPREAVEVSAGVVQARPTA